MPDNEDELAMLPSALYREEVFTDRKVGLIRVLTPITVDGMMDVTRRVVYTGEAQVLTTAGVLPLAFEIDAGSLAEAVVNFGACAKATVERTAEQLQEMRRQAASSLIVTDRMPGGGAGAPGLIRP
jgi:hypothetical protein